MKMAYATEGIGTYFLVLTVGLTSLSQSPLAALTVLYLTGKTFAAAPGADVTWGRALAVEAIFTFALALVVLNSATARQTEKNSFYGLAIGFTIVVAAFAGGGISGGAFNPAVGIGPVLIDTFMGNGTLANAWLYIVGPLAGAALAALFFRAQNPEPEPGAAIPSAPPGEERVQKGEFTAPRPGGAAR
jgi:aquaporin Z